MEDTGIENIGKFMLYWAPLKDIIKEVRRERYEVRGKWYKVADEILTFLGIHFLSSLDSIIIKVG